MTEDLCIRTVFLMGKEVPSISTKGVDGGREEPQSVDGGWTTWYFLK